MFFCCSTTNMMTSSWIDKNYTCATHCVVPEYIHTPPMEGIGNSLGVGGSQRSKNFSLPGIPSVGKVWITFGTTHSSLSADQFHTKTSGHFTFTWYHCKISYWSEILAPVQQPGWTPASVTRAGMTFCGGIMKTNTEPWEGTRVDLHRRECHPGVM